MIFAICIILLVLWALGLATSYTAGGLIHILLVVGLVLFVVRLFQGRRIMS
ncbi:MAG TPA: lmo0937 family membrane protein [Bryobacteraceae bacterium]|nr:lmo0937 family membrane protein [Bryobacteraceae bacterium]